MNILAKLRRRREKAPEAPPVPYDPARQVAVIRSSICTGEMAAGFRDRESGRFTEVMLIRSLEDEEKFKKIFHLESVKTEY